MVDSETKTELNYIVWQYLQKESPSLAAKFKKSKKIKPREGEVTLFSLYDVYIRNKVDTFKRSNEGEAEKSPGNKEALFCQDENNVEDSLTEVNEEDESEEEIKKGDSKEDDKPDDESGTSKKKSEVEKSPVSRKSDLSQEDSVEDGITEVNKKDIMTERNKMLKNTADSKEDEKSDDKPAAAKTKGGSKTEKSPANKKAKQKKMLKSKEDNKEGEKSDDESDAAKRKGECEVEKLSRSKKARLSQEENSIEDGLTEANKEEIKQENSESDNEPSLNEEQKNYDKATEPEDNEKSTVSESAQSSEESSKVKSAKSESKKKRNKKSLLPKPRGKKTLLGIPFSSIHKNDPNFYNMEDRKKTLLPKPSPPVGPSRRKTLLTVPLPTYSDSERTRKTLLPEPLPPPPQVKRSRMPLLGEPLPPPLSRSDRMDLLAESPPLSPLYQDSKERVPLLGHPLESDQRDTMYRREKRPLLDGPRYMSPHNVDDDLSRNRRVLLPKRPPLLLQEEFIPDLADHPDFSDYQLYRRGEAGSSSKPLIFNNEHQRDDSPHLYFRRGVKERSPEISSWEDKEAVMLAKIKDYLKRLSRSSGNFSRIGERLTLMDRSTAEPRRIPHTLVNQNEVLIQKYEEELRSIGIKMTSEMSNTLRRATENEFRPSEQELQYRLFERYKQKMGFL